MKTKQSEQAIVDATVAYFRNKGWIVATEVPNLYRSADVATINNNGEVWVVECKVSAMKQAIRQLQTHRLSADKVFVCTFFRRTAKRTKILMKCNNVGLMYVMPDGSVKIDFEESAYIDQWKPQRDKLVERINQIRLNDQKRQILVK